MSVRLIVHLLLLLALAAAGAWITYAEVFDTGALDVGQYAGTAAAMYWFSALLFGLLASLLFPLLSRSPWVFSVVAYGVIAGGSLFTTAYIVNLGEKNAAPSMDLSLPLPAQAGDGNIDTP